jgi:hypothetical protein
MERGHVRYFLQAAGVQRGHPFLDTHCVHGP